MHYDEKGVTRKLFFLIRRGKEKKLIVKPFFYISKDYIFAKSRFFFLKIFTFFVKFRLTCTYSFKLKKLSDTFLTFIRHLWRSLFLGSMIRLNPPMKFNLIERKVRGYPVFTPKSKIVETLIFFLNLFYSSKMFFINSMKSLIIHF